MMGLPDRFRPHMAGNMRAIIQFELTGSGGGPWTLTIAAGRCQVATGRVKEPDATVTMSADEFAGINTGEIHAPDLFWSGRIGIEGNTEAVIALAPVMGWQ